MTVYLDEAFALNALVDYLLLLCAAKLAGEELRRGRFAISALAGGLYGAAALVPGWTFLAHPACLLAAGVGMALIAYGASRRLLRVSLTFLGTAATFGGGVLWLCRTGGGTVPGLKEILLSAAVCYAFLCLLFRRVTRHGGGELTKAELTLNSRTCRLTVLMDTGNTLTDPLTGKPVLVAEGGRLAPLFPPGKCPNGEELRDPVAALTARSGDGLKWRLLPYRAVGVDRGMLLALRIDKAVIGGEDRGPILVALSPTPVSDGGGYSALIGS